MSINTFSNMGDMYKPNDCSHKESYGDILIKDIASIRLTNALSNVDVFTLQDLIVYLRGKELDDLLKIRNFGKHSLNEVTFLLFSHGIRLDGNYTETASSEKEPKSYNTDTEIGEVASTRLTHALASIGIKTLWQLILYAEHNDVGSLMSVRNFGKNSLMELYAILNKVRSKMFLMEERVPDLSNSHTDNQNVIIIPNIPLKYILNYSFNSDNLALSGIHSTVDLFTHCSQEGIIDLLRTKAFSSDLAIKIYNILSILLDENRWSELSDMMIEKSDIIAYSAVERPTQELFAGIEDDRLEEFVLHIQQLYISQIPALSGRSQNLLNSLMPQFGDLLVYTTLYNESYGSTTYGIKTWNEIWLFAKRIRQEIIRINNLPTDESIAFVALSRMSYECKNENELEFISNFYLKHKHLPMLYILANYVARSENRFERLYRSILGILCKPASARQVAKQWGLTYERVRQIISKQNISNKNIIHEAFWRNYHIDDLLYLSKRSDLYANIRESEGLHDLSFEGLGYMINLLQPCLNLSVNNNQYFFFNRLADCFDIKNALDDIDITLNQRVSKDVDIQISVFSDNYWKKEPNFDPENVVNMLCEIISDNYDVHIDNHKTITIFQNSVDVPTELYEIIKGNGTPMNIDEIYREFKKKYPDHKYASKEKLRPYLCKDDRICPIGKSSRYALTEWGLFTGTIKDLLYETLQNSPVPLTADELCVLIRDIYDTSSKSVRAIIVSDNSDKFVFFKNGYIGLASKTYSGAFDDIKLEGVRRKKAFQEKLDEFEHYLYTHHHLPSPSGTEDEQVLYRWYCNVANKCYPISPENENEFNEMIQRNSSHLVNGLEYAFFRRCDEYKVYLDENAELPAPETNRALYNWFLKNFKMYTQFEDRRKGYFEDLVAYIESYGYSVR